MTAAGTTVRSVHTAARVPGLRAPFDTAHIKVYYRARPTGSESERMTGVVPADREGAPFPVLLLVPGINVTPESYRWLAERLAARGIAVAAYWVVGEAYGGGAAITPVLDLAALSPDGFGSADPAPAIRPVLEALRELTGSGPLEGALDLERVVVAGHSAGGSVALYAAAQGHPGVVGCVTYAAHAMTSTALGWPAGTVLPLGIPLPTLLLAGDCDGVIAASAGRYGEGGEGRADPVGRTFETALAGRRGDSFWMVVGGATHFALADPVDTTAARTFLDPPAAGDQAAVREALARAVELFLDSVVRNDASARDTLAGWVDAPPGPVAAVHRR